MNATKIRRYFDERERKLRRAQDLSRKIVRLCSKGIEMLHRGRSPSKLLQRIKKELDELEKSSPHSTPSVLMVAQQEYAEFLMLHQILEGKDIPEPEQVGVCYEAYLNALADLTGELRRLLLDSLRKQKVEHAEEMLARMEEIFQFLSNFDHPNSIIPGLRHKRDVLRRVLEESRRDLTLAKVKG